MQSPHRWWGDLLPMGLRFSPLMTIPGSDPWVGRNFPWAVPGVLCAGKSPRCRSAIRSCFDRPGGYDRYVPLVKDADQNRRVS